MCAICNGRGFVKAAPVEVVAVWTGSTSESEHHAAAAWHHAIAVPCWVCFPTHLNVLTA